MGCGSTSLVIEGNHLQQTKNVDLSFCEEEEENLKKAQNIISLIIKIRNRIIFLYHKLIYSSAACLYIKPTITHCLLNIFYKISCDLNGNFKKCNLRYIEDAPYLIFDIKNLTNDTKEKLNELLNFIIELRSCKTVLSQIDKDSPQLLYLEFENNKKISNRNIEKIHNSMELFEQLKKLRNKILTNYKEQIIKYFHNNESYCFQIDRIGYEAYEKKLSNIFEIGFLNYSDDKKLNDNEKMFSSIESAKSNWEAIMSKDFDVTFDS